MAKRKKHDGWVIRAADGGWYLSTVTYTKRDCLDSTPWFDQRSKVGDRIVKVKLTEVD